MNLLVSHFDIRRCCKLIIYSVYPSEMKADRHHLKFIAFFIFLLYIYSVTVHEFAEGNSANVVAFTTIKANRGVVVKIDNKAYCRAPRLSITVSARQEKYLRLFWDIEFVREGDWISLFDQDPRAGNEIMPIYSARVNTTTGTIETNFTHIPTNSSELRYHSLCSQYWAVYFTKSGSASTVSCLKTHPTWMYDMRKYLGNIEIKRIFIPGTHDSGSFSSDNGWSSLNLIAKFVYTQDEDILSQLIHGIRYLDLRISSNRHEDERWWINHGVARVQPLKIILEDVKKFLRHTREILILDFHGFPYGFKNDTNSHQDLVNYLKSELSEWIAPPNWNFTCDDLWNINKTLIVSYNHEDTVKANPSFLWSPVAQKWPNAQDVDALKNYFTRIFASHQVQSWAAMAELTPTLWSILTYQTMSLREMAEEVNPHVSSWFRGLWGKSSNIVAVDFFRGTDIVESAIEWNLRKSRKTKMRTPICDIS